MVDIESDGPIPGDYSMIAFGAVIVDSTLKKTFSRILRPISAKWIPDALAVSGYTREHTLQFEEPPIVMDRFHAWLDEQATQIYTQVSIRMLKEVHTRTHPTATLSPEARAEIDDELADDAAEDGKDGLADETGADRLGA